jgi:GT2 family glycosyltransferase
MQSREKTYCLIVTYGNRSALFSRVFERILEESIDRIIVVNNKASAESEDCLKKFKNEYSDKFEIINLSKNTGTAFAFKTGLEYISSIDECKYIWLLDDDNLPEKGTLSKLKQFSEDYEEVNHKEVSLISDRGDDYYINCIIENNPWIAINRINSFWNFHILDVPKKIKSRFHKQLINKSKLSQNYAEIKIIHYGGLFINKKIVKEIGYPDVNYFMYVDDYEFTYRISKAGYKIFFLATTKVNDIERSWGNRITGTQFSRLAKSQYPVRLYYSTRNIVNFQRENTVSNWFIYYVNFMVFIFMFTGACIINLNFKNIVILLKAIYAAYSNEVGESEEYQVSEDI